MVEAIELTTPREARQETLSDILINVNSALDSNFNSFGKEIIPTTLNRQLGVTVHSIRQIQKAAFSEGVNIIRLDGGRSEYRMYDREGVLAFAAVCWEVIERFKTEHPLTISWKEIIDQTIVDLGDNPVKDKLIRQSNESAVLKIKTDFETFFKGRSKDKPKREEGGTPKVVDLTAWDADKVSNILQLLPYDRFNDVRFSAYIPEAIAEVLMRIAYRLKNKEFDYRVEDTILAVDLEGAVNLCGRLLKEGIHGNNLGQLSRSILDPNFENGRRVVKVA